MTEKKPEGESKKPEYNLWQIIMSTCAAAFGVQTQTNRQRDFTEGSIKTYIISGIIFTLIFIGVIVLVVKLVLKHAVT